MSQNLSGMSPAEVAMMTDAEIIRATPNYCGCLKVTGTVGNHGMHFIVVTRHYLEFRQFCRFMEGGQRDPKDFRYDPREEIYLGTLEYSEPCPAYRARSVA